MKNMFSRNMISHCKIFSLRRIRKVPVFLAGRAGDAVHRGVDLLRESYSGKTFPNNLKTHLVLSPEDLDDFSAEHSEQIRVLSDLYCSHYFDLLGSGWVQVRHDMKCGGLEGYLHPGKSGYTPGWTGNVNSSNLSASGSIRGLIDDRYVPIDWHLDFKSGYRWKENTWYRDIKQGCGGGIDMKVPWELSRMQHLPTLAWAFGLAGKAAEGFHRPGVYLAEFRNQMLDFISANPPRFGVNWKCTMDVGIRAVNWVLAFDLLGCMGAEFDEEFLLVFKRSLYEHAKHCMENLENNPASFRNNHYLADIAGILFVAAYLPGSRETARWASFCMRELANEIDSQFNEDGTSFEASTSYHRLSLEIILYCCIICSASGFFSSQDGLLPARAVEKIRRAVDFIKDVTKSSGEVPQIGDNDSGRFVKLWSSYKFMSVRDAKKRYRNLNHYDALADDEIFPDEDFLDHCNLTAMGDLVFGRKIEQNPEIIAFRGLLKDGILPAGVNNNRPEYEAHAAGSEEKAATFIMQLQRRYGNPQVRVFEGENLTDGLALTSYPDFGLFIYKSMNLYMTIRCGGLRLKAPGHAHNDQLSVELTINGKDIIKDPGTYLYTPLPERRDCFRSAKAHYVPVFSNGEQNELLDVFSMRIVSRSEALFFNGTYFLGKLKHDSGEEIYRLIKIAWDKIEISDFSGGQSPVYGNSYYSNGYGKLI